MNKFLSNTKKTFNVSDKKIYHVVMGNETCDLDSAISSITYAYLLYNEIHDKNDECVIPVFNIPAADYPLKTEVDYFLSKNGINLSDLIFRDEIDLFQLHSCGKLKLYLTDHHDLVGKDENLKSAVVYVVDHRPINFNQSSVNFKWNIELVGSCCTLVAMEFFKRMPHILNKEIAQLLHAVIVLDTINFSKEANRFTSVDVDVEKKLRHDFNLTYNNNEIFDELVKARKDISKFTSLQLLRKDLKYVNQIMLPAFHIHVQDFIKRTDAIDVLQNFLQETKCTVAVLMGLVTENGIVTRDIGVYSTTNHLLADRIVNALKNSTNPNLELVQLSSNIENFTLFLQKNVKCSRKVILPIVKNVVENM